MNNTLNKLTIANFFGVDNQIIKADEELDEINEAFETFENDKTLENLKHLVLEVYDLSNVLEGLMVKMGGSVVESQAEKDLKVSATCKIIKEIPKETIDRVSAYNKIRYGGDYDR